MRSNQTRNISLHRSKSIHTINKKPDWFDRIPKSKIPKSKAATPAAKSHVNPSNHPVHIDAQGDGLHQNPANPKTANTPIDTTTDMKTLESEPASELLSSGQNSTAANPNVDMRYVTLRNNEKTYLLDPRVSSSQDKTDPNYFTTPLHVPKVLPRRKLSVYHRSFDVDSLQTPDSPQQSGYGYVEKRRSASTPDVQDTLDFGTTGGKFVQVNNQTYRCANNSDSSCSPSPKRDDGLVRDESVQEKEQEVKISKLVLAPSKFKLPDSTVNQTINISSGSSVPCGKVSEPAGGGGGGEQQSRILSSSSNVQTRKEEKEEGAKSDVVKIKVDSCSVGSSGLSAELSNASTLDVLSSGNSSGCLDLSDNVFLSDGERNDQTYTKTSECFVLVLPITFLCIWFTFENSVFSLLI